jgi:hypothetical protein
MVLPTRTHTREGELYAELAFDRFVASSSRQNSHRFEHDGLCRIGKNREHAVSRNHAIARWW